MNIREELNAGFEKCAALSPLQQLRKLDRGGSPLTFTGINNNEYPIDHLLSPTDKKELLGYLGDRLTAAGIDPIASDPGGNILGLNKAKEVAFWDHDEWDPDAQVTTVAPSLQDLLSRISQQGEPSEY